MSLTPTEEALVRQLLDQQAAILSLAGNESTITSKLGATKVTLSDLVAASSVADADLLLTRQGTNDKSMTAALLAQYMLAEIGPEIQEFSSGTRMPFAQATAPTGWTQDTSDNADNRMLRVVKTEGNGVGGSHSPVLNNVVPSHTHGFTTGTESADHNHADAGHSHSYTAPALRANNAAGSIPDYITIAGSTTGVGYASIGGRSVSHTHSGSTDNGSSQTDWTPRYIDLIICSKN